MQHKHYYRVQANTNEELGYALGTLFKAESQQLISVACAMEGWGEHVDRSRAYLEISKTYFPQYIEELQGYAKGADIDFMELWTRSLEGSLSDHCTTVVTNDGMLIGHNEDWEVGSEDQICILDKTVGATRIIELYYYTTLGGNALSMNAHGITQAINSLAHTDRAIGVPRNVIARWMSETRDPEADFKTLQTIPRSSGYSHVIVNQQGVTWNLECSATRSMLASQSVPFVHTNHFTTDLRVFEGSTNQTGSIDRYNWARHSIKPQISVDELQILLNDQSQGEKTSVFNERTIAKAIVDVQERTLFIWLKREQEKGWIPYAFSST